MEAVFGAMGQAIPERLFAAPAGTSGNFGLGGYDPEEDRHYIMYLFSGGGDGGWGGKGRASQRCPGGRGFENPPPWSPHKDLPRPFGPVSLRGRAGGGRRGR